MNDAHFHLVVNHLPIIFPMVGIIVWLTGFFSKSEAVKRTSLFIFILGTIAAVMAVASGEGAEEVMQNISGIDEQYIKIHEEAAELFIAVSYVLGGISLVALWASFKQKSFANITSVLALVTALVSVYFGKQTGTTGGEIRHTEIREEQLHQHMQMENERD